MQLLKAGITLGRRKDEKLWNGRGMMMKDDDDPEKEREKTLSPVFREKDLRGSK